MNAQPMNEQQAENLRILIRHMETGVNRNLHMGAVMSSCGTPACAFGEAACMPHFNALGLCPVDRATICAVLWKGFESCIGDCSDEIFGTYGGNALSGGGTRAKLFGGSYRNAWKRDNVTPQEWAIEARKVLAENGYSMESDFDRFMAKVREPVSLTKPESVLR